MTHNPTITTKATFKIDDGREAFIADQIKAPAAANQIDPWTHVECSRDFDLQAWTDRVAATSNANIRAH